MLVAPAAAGGELNDHSGAVFAHAFLHCSVQLRVGTRGFVAIAHVHMHQRRTSLKGLVRGLDLLGWRDRHGRIVFLARQCTGNRYRYDDGCSH